MTEVLSEIQHAGLDVQFRNKIFYSLKYSKMYQQGGVDKDLGKGGQSFTQRIRQEEAQCFCFPLDLQDSAWSVQAPGDFFFFLPCCMGVLNSPARDQNCVPFIARWILNHWTTREVPCLVILTLIPPTTTKPGKS